VTPRALSDAKGVLANITLSAGLATMDESTKTKFTDAESLVNVACKALEAAQKAGRNVMRVYAPKAA